MVSTAAVHNIQINYLHFSKPDCDLRWKSEHNVKLVNSKFYTNTELILVTYVFFELVYNLEIVHLDSEM